MRFFRLCDKCYMIDNDIIERRKKMALSEEAKRARREYWRKYFEEHPEQREKKNACRKEWGNKPENKAKLKKYTENFWERKAREVVTND